APHGERGGRRDASRVRNDRGTLMRRLIVIAGSLALALTTPAGASEGRWGLTAAGDRLLTAPARPDGALPEWWACPPDAQCRRIAGRERRVEPGATAPGTVFDVEVGLDYVTGEGYVAKDERSPTWGGHVTVLARPA